MERQTTKTEPRKRFGLCSRTTTQRDPLLCRDHQSSPFSPSHQPNHCRTSSAVVQSPPQNRPSYTAAANRELPLFSTTNRVAACLHLQPQSDLQANLKPITFKRCRCRRTIYNDEIIFFTINNRKTTNRSAENQESTTP
ncbi:hypothetical protein V8G54_000996 [Vigna mungo]|uniref:Uncharacterized protein n=1 Tax=Vigna mungo TaxID=3915 RepID=A0AAQ3P7W8_VIGMU